METYLKVKKGSDVDSLLNKHRETMEKWRLFALDFAKEFGIESNKFYISKELAIKDLTKNELDKFSSQLRKDGESFKKNSNLYKEYQKRLEDSGLMHAKFTLIVWDYKFNDVYGRHSIQRFNRNGIWYIKLTTEFNVEIPTDYDVIKASEYYLAQESK